MTMAARVMGSFTHWLVVLLLLLSISISQAEESESDDTNYLYHGHEDYEIVDDYQDENDFTPAFLFTPVQVPRVVEFYAPWCPHCQHFRSHYVKFAEQMQEITSEYNLPPIQFHAVSCTVHKKVCKSMKVHGYPKIKLFAKGAFQNATAEIPYWKLHPFDVLSALRMDIGGQHALPDKNLMESDSHLRTATTDDSSTSVYRTKRNIYDDSYRSLDFTLRNGVFVQDDGPLSNSTRDALRDMLELLQKTTPVVWDGHRVLRTVLEHFDTIVKSEDALVDLLDRPGSPQPPKHWSASCTKGVTGMGYTCGLWELFHMMSVGVVEYNLMIGTNDHSIVEELSVKTTHAAETLRNFVEHFFGCDECRYNFLQSYDACAFDRCNRLDDNQLDSDQWIQFPLWLFEVHNAVNKRLVRERAQVDNSEITASDEEASQWPPKPACKKCWLETGGWHEKSIFKYLRIEYWQDDFVSKDYRAEVGAVREVVVQKASVPPPQTPLAWVILLSIGSLVGFKSFTKVQLKRRSGHRKKCEDC